MGHVKMMAAIQPFVSGALSKTVNLPAEATVDDVADVYFQGWKLGLKALAIYRNNSKVGQPLSSKKDSEKGADDDVVVATRPTRKRLPKKRRSQTVSFAVAGAEGYMTAGEYDDGTLGEVFIKMSKQGSTLAGVMDAFSVSISIGLQYGVPLEAFVSKYINMRFDPAGMTDDADIRIAQSVMDYLFRRWRWTTCRSRRAPSWGSSRRRSGRLLSPAGRTGGRTTRRRTSTSRRWRSRCRWRLRRLLLRVRRLRRLLSGRRRSCSRRCRGRLRTLRCA
jgi:hypothetical protein